MTAASAPKSARAAIAFYAAGTLFDKVFSLVTIPLMAASIAPGSYGDYELVLSLCTFLLAISGLGIADTMIRFVSTAPEGERNRVAAELLGATLAFIAVFALILQLCAGPFTTLLGIRMDLSPVRWTLLATSVSGVIELGVIWLRLQDRAQLFFYFGVARTVGQVAATWLALLLGYGAEGVLIANAWVGIGFALTLTAMIGSEIGVRWSRHALHQIFGYGLPLVIGGVALFMVTTINRWFLPQHTTHEEIGLLGVAARLAMAAGLLLYPFAAWWFPKRIAELATESGRRTSEVMWGYGIGIVIVSCAGAALVGPLLIKLVFPASYAGASAYLELSVLAVGVAQLVLICNAGLMARQDSRWACAIDILGAIVSLIALVICIPKWGVTGAILATILAQVVRLVATVLVGRSHAPLELPYAGALAVGSIATACVWLSPSEASPVLRLAWSTVVACILLVSLHVLHVVRIPATLTTAAFSGMKRLTR